MDTLLGLLAAAAILIFALGFVPFGNAFREKFGRSFIHWGNIATVVMLGVALVCMDGSGVWEAVCYISCTCAIGLAVWQIRKYGLGWGIGVWAYNMLAIAFVISVISAISKIFKDDKK